MVGSVEGGKEHGGTDPSGLSCQRRLDLAAPGHGGRLRVVPSVVEPSNHHPQWRTRTALLRGTSCTLRPHGRCHAAKKAEGYEPHPSSSEKDSLFNLERWATGTQAPALTNTSPPIQDLPPGPDFLDWFRRRLSAARLLMLREYLLLRCEPRLRDVCDKVDKHTHALFIPLPQINSCSLSLSLLPPDPPTHPLLPRPGD